MNRRDFRLAHELCLKALTLDPKQADALFLLGVIAAEHRNYGKALEVIDRAIAMAPGKAEYFAQRGRCLVALHRPREAFEAARQALELKPTEPLTLDTIGVVMTRAGAHAEAIEPFRAACASAGATAQFHYNLGAALQFVGEFTAAEAEYRHALRLEPRFYRAWSSLAQVARAALRAGDVAVLEQALAGSALDPDAELHVCHALAKQYEDEERYEPAFRLLARGKRRKSATLDYEFASDAALFAAAERLTASLAAAPSSNGCASREPIFIVGMPRTGTTLVERILSSHPDVFAAGELTNFGLVLKRATGTSSNRVLDPETLDASPSCDLAAVGAAYIDSTRPRTGHTQRFVDKMPLNFFYVPLIQRALPNARIICLRRNPLDACLSNYRQLFATSFSYYNYAYDLLDTGRYYAAFDRLCARWRATVSSYLEVRYEDVVEHTEREARRLTDFCGLTWDPRCLAFEENAAPVATASSVQVRQPIYRTSLERWRRYERELAPLRSLLTKAGAL